MKAMPAWSWANADRVCGPLLVAAKAEPSRSRARYRARVPAGTTIAEMPVALWIIVLLCFSLLILATETIRFGFFWNACRESAQTAARCQTFLANTTGGGPSACSTADSMATSATQAFSGLILTQVNVYILATNVTTQATTKNPSRQPLANAADVTQNLYYIQVELIGQIQPLITFPITGWVGNVPGLTAPFPITVRSQYSAEVPQGLNQ